MSASRPVLVNTFPIESPIKGTAETYNLGGMSFELLRHENGKIHTDPEEGDGSYLAATQYAQAWLDWAGFLETQE